MSNTCKFKDCIKHAVPENEYCIKHQKQAFIDETIAEGKKVCVNHIRGCRAKLETDYKFSRCGVCLEKDREKDRQKRTLAKAKSEEAEKSAEKITEKPCTCCCKVLPIELFVGVKNNITKHCKNCRDDNKTQDARRDKEHRNELARICDKKPERIAVKKEWKENNYEKVAETWMNSRNARIERMGVEEYQKQNAENAQNWRNNNPEKVEQNNENKKKSLTIQYSTYKTSANSKNLVFEITFDEYTEIVKQKCYYCGDMHERGFNGIDRFDSEKGYILDNCVSCCQMCNYIKGSLHGDVFIKRIEHILSYNNLIEDKKYYPELFDDTKTIVPITKYFSRAMDKDIVFELSKEQFNNLVMGDCYLCGKKTNDNHRNGIDRFYNNIGYTVENSRTCCGQCNYMKRNYSYAEIINKYKKICKIHLSTTLIIIQENNIIIDIVNDTTNIICNQNNRNIVKNKNKKTKEEIAEGAKLRKRLQRERLKEKYGDEEYKKMRANEIAKLRANKKLKSQTPLQTEAEN